ncbi:transposase [Streptomyces populi]
MSLPAPVPAGGAWGLLSCFRVEFHESLCAREDTLFELTEAVLCTDGPVKTPVELFSAAEHRRGHGVLYAVLDRGWIEPTRLCRVPAGLPVPQAAEGRIVHAVDVSHWLRPTPWPATIGCSATSADAAIAARTSSCPAVLLRHRGAAVLPARRRRSSSSASNSSSTKVSCARSSSSIRDWRTDDRPPRCLVPTAGSASRPVAAATHAHRPPALDRCR